MSGGGDRIAAQKVESEACPCEGWSGKQVDRGRRGPLKQFPFSRTKALAVRSGRAAFSAHLVHGGVQLGAHQPLGQPDGHAHGLAALGGRGQVQGGMDRGVRIVAAECSAWQNGVQGQQWSRAAEQGVRCVRRAPPRQRLPGDWHLERVGHGHAAVWCRTKLELPGRQPGRVAHLQVHRGDVPVHLHVQVLGGLPVLLHGTGGGKGLRGRAQRGAAANAQLRKA